MPIIRETSGKSDDSQHPFDDIESNSILNTIDLSRYTQNESKDANTSAVPNFLTALQARATYYETLTDLENCE